MAKNFLSQARGKAMTPFKYFDRGDMVIIGKTVCRKTRDNTQHDIVPLIKLPYETPHPF